MTTAPSSDSPPARPGLPAPAGRSVRHLFAVATLGTQVFVFGFAGLVAYGLRLAPPEVIWPVVGFAVALCLAALALLRGLPGRILGSLVQVVSILAGLIIPMMWILGTVFAALWILAMVLGAKIDREKAAYAAAEAGGRTR
ncbi:DUF4233 domain-containing protein [Pseudactinotalea sp. HY158]|uniref:DUF4233 domain-containing protein n=1 Tax=Pseudactinotalea sp. HY158 TaxID=2654547 RepID=UPI00129C5CED|nr:DUF4233 domain-containing protein [Pseudactinotalea sp. HY158]QGH69920.1 DUF4233 domain-containing protein [Pseudactinotalea sp. HY158]